MKRLISFTFVVSVALLAGSCAKDAETLSYTQYEIKAVQQWMAKYVTDPDIKEVANYPGMFRKIIHTTEGSGTSLSSGNWAKISYTIRTLGSTKPGNYVESRYRTIANQMGWYLNTTNYIPDYVQYNTDYSATLTFAHVNALGAMTEGDSAVIYTSSNYAYGTSSYSPTSSYGFGSGTVNANTPVMITLKLNKIVTAPLNYEEEQALRYAKDSIGDDFITDTTGFYYRIRRITPANDQVIGKDSVVKINYVGKFLNGFLLDTNIPEMAQKWGRTAANSGKALSLTVSSSSYISAFQRILLKMHKGETADVVFSSNFGYESSGKAGSPYIQPYTPLFYSIEVLLDE